MHFNTLKFSKLSNSDHENSVSKGRILSGCSWVSPADCTGIAGV